MEPKQKPTGLPPKTPNSKAHKPKIVKAGAPKGAPEWKAIQTNLSGEQQGSSPNEYAEQQAEQYSEKVVTVTTQSAQNLQARARQAAIRRFQQAQQEKQEAAAEQAQTFEEQTLSDAEQAAQNPSATESEPVQSADLPQMRGEDLPRIPEERTTLPASGADNPLHRKDTAELSHGREPVRQNRTGSSISTFNGEKQYGKGKEETAFSQTQKADQIRLPEPDREQPHFRNPSERGPAVSPKQRLVPGAEKEAHLSVKTAQHGVKEAHRTLKTSQQTVKTAQQTARTAQATAKTMQKTAQASAKAAQVAKEASIRAAQAAAKAAQAAGKALAAAVKAIIAALEKLVAAMAAGGWVSVIVIAVIAVIALILSLCFGVFYSNDVSEGRPMTAAISEINGDFVDSINARINRYKRQYKPDEMELVYEGDTDSSGSVMNWADVLGIYAVSTTTDPDQPTDVLIVTPEKVEILRSIFQRMNSASYHTEIETEEIPIVNEDGMPLIDEEGNPITETKTKLTITIRVSSMDYRDAASLYNFNENQYAMLKEMMKPEYYPLYAKLTGDVIGDGGEYGFGLDINPDLPPSELGYQIVQAAKRYIGRSYASMDCSKFARTAYADVGLTSMNGLSSVRMAKKCREMGCLFTDPSQLQAGDLIFFARFDPSRGKDYCGDIGRCGTGKCRRWLHIHHVAIYINDEYLIDSVGGDNSVQIRKLYGQNTARWKWVCFGRPTT
ncbi:MAG: hypothetical protein IJ138_05645 [Clostridia bacterium]|nr:hypothetical protein [Clostridia bacterium]